MLEEESCAKKVKTEEAGDKVKSEGEGDVEKQEKAEPSKSETMMSKKELIELHLLTPYAKNTHGKTWPVYCRFCDKIFEGRNRAKINQHTTGLEHRRLWRNGGPDLAEAVKEEDEEKAFNDGKCKGLRLKSSIAARTRLGSDLLPVWKSYVAFAHLGRRGPDRHDHQGLSWSILGHVGVLWSVGLKKLIKINQNQSKSDIRRMDQNGEAFQDCQGLG